MAKRNRKVKVRTDDRIPPTPEQALRGDFASAGMAYKRVAVIETMLTRGQIAPRDYLMLLYYRDCAHAAQDSEANESPISLSKMMGGGSGGHPIGGYTPKSCMDTWDHCETARIERDMGSVWQLARAVAVDDISLTEWCIARHGGRERYGPKGNFIAMVPVREKSVIGIALIELRMAARRIAK